MKNEEVLDEYTGLAGGDDDDGCWTINGQWMWEQINAELSLRLETCGFLNNKPS